MTNANESRRQSIAGRAHGRSLVHLVGLLGAMIAPGIVIACSDSDEDGDAAAVSSSSGTSTGSGGADPGSGSGGDPFTTSSGSGAGGGLGGGCASESFEGDLVPLDIYMVFDQSYSMNQTADGTSTRWEAVTVAVKAFVQSSPPDISVGLQYFPLFQTSVSSCVTDIDCPNGGFCLQGEGGGHCLPEPAYDCSAASYAVPDVALAPLPGNESAIIASLDAHYPYGGTPTGPALQGAIDYASTWSEQNPAHKTVVVLATDGYPTNCPPNDIASIAAIAEAGVQADPSILTFVIGVGDGLDNLNAIATAGGTSEAFLVTDANASEQFAAALEAIRTSLACEFVIPTPTSGEPDFDKVNVQYTPGGGRAEIIGQVEGPEACSMNGGWYYDDPQNPTTILLCPASCDVAKSDPDGKVDVVLGCKTIIAEPA